MEVTEILLINFSASHVSDFTEEPLNLSIDPLNHSHPVEKPVEHKFDIQWIISDLMILKQ